MENNNYNGLFIALLKQLKKDKRIHFNKLPDGSLSVFNSTHAHSFKVLELPNNGGLKFDFVCFSQAVDIPDLKKFVEYYQIFKFNKYIFIHYPKYFTLDSQQTDLFN